MKKFIKFVHYFQKNLKMIEKLSLKKNLIKYDTETKDLDIESILDKRFENGEFIMNWTFADLHNPYDLQDMQKAVERIKEAKEEWGA